MVDSPQIQNVVCTCNVGSTLYLPYLVRALPCAEYNSKRFAAVAARLVDPKATALFFGSGKIVCTGTKSKNAARLALLKFVRLVRCLNPEVSMYNFVIQNVVASAQFPFHLNLSALRAKCGAEASYEPELFPGLIYRPVLTHLVFLVFSSGRMVITGAKNATEINTEYQILLKRYHAFGPSIIASSAIAGRALKKRDPSMLVVLTNRAVLNGDAPLNLNLNLNPQRMATTSDSRRTKRARRELVSPS